MMEPTCDWCGDDFKHGEYKVVVTKRGNPDETVKTLKLCKKCAKKL